MPKQVWMVAEERWGCPISTTIVVPGRVTPMGTTFSYTFERNRATTVADEDVEFILQQTVMDKTNRPQSVFKIEPPRQELNDADQIRMRLESAEEKVNQLLGMLAGENPELSSKLGLQGDERPNLLEGLA